MAFYTIGMATYLLARKLRTPNAQKSQIRALRRDTIAELLRYRNAITQIGDGNVSLGERRRFRKITQLLGSIKREWEWAKNGLARKTELRKHYRAYKRETD